MATDPREIQRLLDQLNAAYRALGERNPFENFDPSKITDAEAEIEKLEIALEGVKAKIDRLSVSFGDLNKTLKNIVQEISPRAFNATKEFSQGFKNIINEAKKLQYEEEGISRLSKQQILQIKERIKQQEFETRLAAERVLSEDQIGREALKYKDTINSTWEIYQNLSEAQKSALGFLQDQESTIGTISDKLDKRLKQEEEITKILGLGGNAISGIGKALDKLGMGGLSNILGINEAKAEMEDLARTIIEGKQKQLDLEFKISELRNKPTLTEDDKEQLELLEKELGERIKSNNELTKGGERTAILGKGISTLGSNLKRNLTDPLVVGGFLIDQFVGALIKADKSTGDLAKSMNMTYNEANNLRSELNTIANLSGDNFVTTQKLQESLVAINQTLGTNAMINEKDLVTFTKLRETAGLTNEELMGIQAISLANGKTLENNTGEIMAQAKISSVRNGIALNEKEILKGIKDISAATTLTLGKNPKALADAVVQAKSLGMEIKQIEQIAQSLLNFEESISSELEAELLTGRQLNLEQARYYALTGDVANLAKELSTQLGSAEEFGRLNVIQQEALAKSMGMGREELAKTLFVQEQLRGATGEEAKIRERRLNQLIAEKGLAEAQRILAEEGVDGLEQQASIGDRLNASMEKLQEIFVTMSPAILAIGDALTGILNIINPIFMLLGGISEFFGSIGEKINSFIGPLGIFKDILKAAASAAVVYAAYKTFGAVAAGLASIPFAGVAAPFVGAAAAAAVAAAGFGLISKIKDGVVDTKKGVIFSGEYGSVQLDEKDQAVLKDGMLTAGTDLFNNKIQPSTPSTSPQPSISPNSQPSISVNPAPPINLSSLESKMDKLEQTNALLTQLIKKDTSVYMDGAKVGKSIALAGSNLG